MTTYSDTTVSPSTHYYYRAKAYNLVGDSSYSNEAKVSKKIFFDDMESGTAEWIADAPWGQITSDFHSSTTCWTDSPSGDYSNSSNISLTSIQFSLATGTSATLTFWHHYEIEYRYDYGYVEISTDGGLSWAGLTSFTGTMGIWTQKIIGLTPYLGSSSVKIRFRLYTDGSVTYDGWFIDDVSVVGCDY